MEDKYFKPTGAMETAIQEKDKEVLRALLVGIIGSDPTFETTEFDEALEYIKGKGINLNESYKEQDGQKITHDEKEWTREYFGLNLVWLKDNFELRIRLKHLKTVGKHVYKDTKTMGKMRKEQFEKKQIAVETTSGDKSKGWLTAIMAVGIVMLIAVLWFSFRRWY